MNIETERLKRLPQRAEEIWLGAQVRIPAWVRGEDGEPTRPRIALWVAVQGQVVSQPTIEDSGRPTGDLLWRAFVGFAHDPENGGYRPGAVEIADEQAAAAVRESLESIGVAVHVVDSSPLMDQLVDNLATNIDTAPLAPGYSSGDQVTERHMRRFAEAAEQFYHAAPWRILSDEDPITITAPAAPPGMRHMAVLGAGGQEYGLGFYDTLEDLWDARRLDDPAAWFFKRKHGVWQFTYDRINGLPFEDADLWLDEHLPVACPQAYPWVLGTHPDEGVIRPDARRLVLVEAVLRVLAEADEDRIDRGRITRTVETAEGPIELTLELPDLLNPPDFQELHRRGYLPSSRTMESYHHLIDRFLESRNIPDDPKLIQEAVNNEFVGKRPDPADYPPRDDHERAQNLCFEAFDAIGRRQVQLARQALAIDPDCTDAYVILAERCADTEEAADLYRRGVEAGERLLGEDRFREDAGAFWQQLDTRPYMRARFGLAQCLSEIGREDEALDHYAELLRLNPDDNQGVRDCYLPLLIECERDDHAITYIESAPPENSAHRAYVEALLAFRREGDTKQTRKQLKEATRINPHVPEALLADEMNQPLPAMYAPGSPEEAAICAEQLRPAFEVTPEAWSWLESQRPGRKRRLSKNKSKKRRRKKRKTR